MRRVKTTSSFHDLFFVLPEMVITMIRLVKGNNKVLVFLALLVTTREQQEKSRGQTDPKIQDVTKEMRTKLKMEEVLKTQNNNDKDQEIQVQVNSEVYEDD